VYLLYIIWGQDNPCMTVQDGGYYEKNLNWAVV
jgi:hypothetical protein